jgi:hypothetical protein
MFSCVADTSLSMAMLLGCVPVLLQAEHAGVAPKLQGKGSCLLNM